MFLQAQTTLAQESEPLLRVLLKQAPVVILSVVCMVAMYRYMKSQIRHYQKRNDELSTLLVESAVQNSERLLSANDKAWKEREAMRTELLLQCDSMSRNTLDFLKQGLLESLGKSGDNSG